MTRFHTTEALLELNNQLARKLNLEPCPLNLVTETQNTTQSYNPNGVYVLHARGIDWHRPTDEETASTEIIHYGAQQRGLADLFLDAYAQKSPDFPEHRAAMFLAFSPLFWSLRSKLALPAGRLPFGYMLQNTITTLALLALAVVFLLRNSDLIPPKPVAFYMSMCFILALSSIIRVGELWDDAHAKRRLRLDFSQRTGILLALLVPCYYYAYQHHRLLEKPLQYTLLSTTAAAVFMAFFNKPKA